MFDARPRGTHTSPQSNLTEGGELNNSRTYARKLRSVALMLGLVAALAAVVASPAMATKVNTKFNATTIKLSGTGLTTKLNGAEPKTCELASITGTASASGSFTDYKEAWPSFQTVLPCAGGTKLWLTLLGSSYYDTTTGNYTVSLNYGPGALYYSPYGEYYAGYSGKEITATWVNGTALTPSTIVFNESYLGKLKPALSANVTLNGTMTATTSTGGLLTLSH
jgi:hypothetical protein